MKHRKRVVAAVLLVAVGVFAGRWAALAPSSVTGSADDLVPFAPDLVKTRGVSAVGEAAAPDLPEKVSDDVTRMPATAADMARGVQSPLPGKLHGVPAVSESRQQRVRELVRNALPTADPSIVDVLTEEYAELSDDTVTFLLSQQKTAGSGVIIPSALIFDRSFGDETPVDSTGPPTSPDPVRTDVGIESTARANLKNTDTVGYRSLVPLSVVSPGYGSEAERSELRNFACGRFLITGDPIHLAIQTPGLHFFQLEDGRLTRNGLFARLPGGQVGLRFPNVTVALMDAPLIPVDTTSLKVDATSWTVYAGPADAQTPCGAIRIVTVTDPLRLDTVDGVYFRTSSRVELATGVNVRSGVLELSNVNIDMNLWLAGFHRQSQY